MSALAGSVAAAGIVLLIGLVYSAIRGGQGYGMGDVKLLAAMGVYLGLYSLMALFIGTLIGAVYGVVSARRSSEGGQHSFPFGPFLAIGGVVDRARRSLDLGVVCGARAHRHVTEITETCTKTLQ